MILRAHFDRELTILQDRLIALGSQVEQNIIETVNAYHQRNWTVAKRLIAGDSQVNHEQIAIEEQSLRLIATQQPTAGDLRQIASIIAIASELERMNDYAKGIGQITLRVCEKPVLAPAGHLRPMAQIASTMLNQALQAFVRRDLTLAYAIYARDDEVDNLYNQTYQEILDLIIQDVQVTDQATHLLWAAHNLERTADRVGNICERVIFVVTGKIVELPEEFESPPNQNL